MLGSFGAGLPNKPDLSRVISFKHVFRTFYRIVGIMKSALVRPQSGQRVMTVFI